MNEDILVRNLKAMEKWYPEFAEGLRAGKYKKDKLEVIKEISEDGELIFRIKQEERYLYLNGVRNAKKPLELMMSRLGDVHKYAPVFLLGIGSGLYFKKIIADTDSSVAVVIYEPSMNIFMEMLSQVDLKKEIEDRPVIFIVNGYNESVFKSVLDRVVSYENVEFLKVEIHPNYQELFAEDIVEKTKRIRKRTDDIIMNENSGSLFSAYLVRNQMLNMRYVCDGYHTKSLVETVPYQGPAILVAAGPSLNKNIKELKAAKNKAFILAVDTALKPLIRAGIYPDAFCTIDPKKPLDLVQMDEIKDIPIIAPVTSNADIIEQQRGKKIFYYDGYMLAQHAYLSAGKLLPEVSTGGSVACSGFSLLYKMGFDTIILVGQDLAYTDNKSHADGTFKDEMPVENTKRMMRVKGNYEDTVPTLANLKIYLAWFEEYIEGIKKRRNVRVINATEGGAFIKGTELMLLRDAIKETCGTEEIDFRACVESIKPAFTEEQRKRVVDFLHSVPQKFEDIRLDAVKLYNIYHKINRMCNSGNLNKSDYRRDLKKVKKITKKCESHQLYQLVASTMSVGESIVKGESLYELDTIEEEGKAISKQGMQFANLIQQCSKILKEFAEEILLDIQ